eukprot:scaffold53_cov193-Pinguiococcus_pyrenoidosus.AAC.73
MRHSPLVYKVQPASRASAREGGADTCIRIEVLFKSSTSEHAEAPRGAAQGKFSFSQTFCSTPAADLLAVRAYTMSATVHLHSYESRTLEASLDKCVERKAQHKPGRSLLPGVVTTRSSGFIVVLRTCASKAAGIPATIGIIRIAILLVRPSGVAVASRARVGGALVPARLAAGTGRDGIAVRPTGSDWWPLRLAERLC